MDEKQAIQRELIDDFLPEARELVQRVRRQTSALMEDPQSVALRQELTEDLDRLAEEAGFLGFDSLAEVGWGISRLLRAADKGTVYPELLSDLLTDGGEAIIQGVERLCDHDNRPLGVATLLHRIEVVLRSRDTDLTTSPADDEMSADPEFAAAGSIDAVETFESADRELEQAADQPSLPAGDVTPEGLVADLPSPCPEWSRDGFADSENGDEGNLPEEPAISVPAQAADRRTSSTSQDGHFALAPDSPRRDQELRVEAKKIDGLIATADALMLERDRLVRLTPALQQGSGRDADLDSVFAAADRVGGLTSQLRRSALEMRTIPAERLFASIAGLIGELAREADVEVELVIGDSTAVFDRLVVDEIRELLLSLIRNAVAHSIEEPEVRRDGGKAPRASLSLSAVQEGADILIEMVEDGNGLSLEHIQLPEQAQDPGQKLFAPGCVDTELVRRHSGLGVGMHVIEAAIARLGGTMELQSEPGRGTEISIRLPISVTTVQGVQVGVGAEEFVIPRYSVLEILKLTDADAEEARTARVIMVREKILPLVDLYAELGLKRGDGSIGDTYLLVARAGEREAGMFVDRVIAHVFARVDEVPEMAGSASGIGGSTILEDDRVRLILDVSELLSLGEHRLRADSEAESAG